MLAQTGVSSLHLSTKLENAWLIDGHDVVLQLPWPQIQLKNVKHPCFKFQDLISSSVIHWKWTTFKNVIVWQQITVENPTVNSVSMLYLVMQLTLNTNIRIHRFLLRIRCNDPGCFMLINNHDTI